AEPSHHGAQPPRLELMLKRLVAILAAALLAGAAAAVFLVGRGHKRQPARTVATRHHHPATHKAPSGFSWPDYGFDLARTHAAPSGRTLWRFRAGVIETPPLLAGGRVYFGSWDQRVYAVDARTGRLDWSFTTGGRIKGGAAFAGGTIFAGSYDGRLYALESR